MENQRVCTVGCNILTQLDSMCYANHCQVWYRLGRNHTDFNFFFNAPRRVSIDNMRNGTIDHALKTGSEFVFFYDDDVLVPTDAFAKLLKVMDNDTDAAVVSGLTYIRKFPFDPMLFKSDEEMNLTGYKDFKEHVDENGLLEKDLGAVGFSCVLIRTSFLKDLKPPYCITGSQNTEDVYLCHRIRNHFPNAKILCDTTIDTSHLVERYFINDEGRSLLLNYEKDINGAEVQSDDRGIEYAESIESRLREQPDEERVS